MGRGAARITSLSLHLAISSAVVLRQRRCAVVILRKSAVGLPISTYRNHLPFTIYNLRSEGWITGNATFTIFVASVLSACKSTLLKPSARYSPSHFSPVFIHQ